MNSTDPRHDESSGSTNPDADALSAAWIELRSELLVLHARLEYLSLMLRLKARRELG